MSQTNGKNADEKFYQFNPVWWEKSVEYKFVLERITKNCIKPLSGTAEKAIGDAILQFGSKFRIIEFKKDRANFWTETKKYRSKQKIKSYKIFSLEAAQSIGAKYIINIPHYFVYGFCISNQLKLENNDRNENYFPELSLKYCNYWDNTPVSPDFIFDKEFGMSSDEFLKYILFLIEKRLDLDDEGMSGRSLALFEMFNSKVTMSLYEAVYAIRHSLRLEHLKNQNRREDRLPTIKYKKTLRKDTGKIPGMG